MSNTLTVRLPKKLQSQLQSISREKKVPVSDLVRHSLNRYLALYRFRKLRSQALPYAEAQGFFTDEDIFTQIS